jgi:hypothetical protein
VVKTHCTSICCFLLECHRNRGNFDKYEVFRRVVTFGIVFMHSCFQGHLYLSYEKKKSLHQQRLLSDWREKQCETGKGAARSGTDCVVAPSAGGEYRKVSATLPFQNTHDRRHPRLYFSLPPTPARTESSGIHGSALLKPLRLGRSYLMARVCKAWGPTTPSL